MKKIIVIILCILICLGIGIGIFTIVNRNRQYPNEVLINSDKDFIGKISQYEYEISYDYEATEDFDLNLKGYYWNASKCLCSPIWYIINSGQGYYNKITKIMVDDNDLTIIIDEEKFDDSRIGMSNPNEKYPNTHPTYIKITQNGGYPNIN